MKEWLKGFWQNHGDRVFFMSVSTIFGLAFLSLGTYKSLEPLTGAGTTLLIAVATLALNKARGPNGKPEVKP